MPGIAERLTSVLNTFFREEFGVTGSARRSSPSRRPRARSNTTTEAAEASPRRRGRPPAAKMTISDLPGYIAREYPNGATTAQVRRAMKWSATAPMSNIDNQLVKTGMLAKQGNRYVATTAQLQEAVNA